MKTTLSIYFNDYEIEIKARDKRNLNASTKAAKIVLQWLESRMWEASHEHEDKEESEFYKEIRDNASVLHKIIRDNESN